MKFNVTIASPSPLLALGSLLFNGTAVWLEGPSPPPSYTIQLDEVPYAGLESGGYLFVAQGLSQTSMHTLSVQPSSIFESALVEMDLEADVAMIVDDSALFSSTEGTVQVRGEWMLNQCLGGGRLDDTCHTSGGTGGSITYTFQGDGITVYGSLENVRSRYTVSIDGSSPQIYSSNNGTLRASSVVLAHASALGGGSHTITIFNTPLDGESRMEIDYLTLYTQSDSTTSSPRNGISTGTRIGLIIGTLGGCAIVALTLFLVLWRRQHILSKDDLPEASFIDPGSNFSGSMMFQHTKHSDLTLAESHVEKPIPATTAASGFDAPWDDRMHRQSIHPMGDTDFDAAVAGRTSPLAFLSRWRKQQV